MGVGGRAVLKVVAEQVGPVGLGEVRYLAQCGVDGLVHLIQRQVDEGGGQIQQQLLVLAVPVFAGLPGGCGLLVLVDLAHQAQGVAGQAAVNAQDDVDQRARGACHQRIGLLLGGLQIQAGLHGLHGVGHAPVGFEDVRGQPAGQEVQQSLGHISQRALGKVGPQGLHAGNEVPVPGPVVLGFLPVLRQVVRPDGFFVLKVIDGVGGQLIQNGFQGGPVGRKRQLAGQLVEQLHQLAVLCIHRGQARIEVLIPRKNVDLRVHGSSVSRHLTYAMRRTYGRGGYP